MPATHRHPIRPAAVAETVVERPVHVGAVFERRAPDASFALAVGGEHVEEFLLFGFLRGLDGGEGRVGGPEERVAAVGVEGGGGGVRGGGAGLRT